MKRNFEQRSFPSVAGHISQGSYCALIPRQRLGTIPKAVVHNFQGKGQLGTFPKVATVFRFEGQFENLSPGLHLMQAVLLQQAVQQVQTVQ